MEILIIIRFANVQAHVKYIACTCHINPDSYVQKTLTLTLTHTESVRVWSFDGNNVGPEVVSAWYKEKNLGGLPNFIDMHPLGKTVVFACDDEIKEMAITDSHIINTLSIPAKITGNNNISGYNPSLVLTQY